jgi:glycine cleavage system aminomethyltransferase T
MTSTTLTSKPHRLSPLYHKQSSLGAKFVQDQFGWVRAERFVEPADEKNRTERAVGVYDLSHLIKLSLKSSDATEAISTLYNRKSAKGTLLIDGPGALKDALCSILSNDEVILITNSSSNEAIRRRLSEGASKFQTVDVTSVLGGVYVIGGKSRAVLSKLTELNVNPEDFPNLKATNASLHHVQCIVLRLDLGNLTGYQIYFERAYGEYMWDIIFHAGKEFGMIPVGSAAMSLLGWRLE